LQFINIIFHVDWFVMNWCFYSAAADDVVVVPRIQSPHINRLNDVHSAFVIFQFKIVRLMRLLSWWYLWLSGISAIKEGAVFWMINGEILFWDDMFWIFGWIILMNLHVQNKMISSVANGKWTDLSQVDFDLNQHMLCRLNPLWLNSAHFEPNSPILSKINQLKT